MIPIVTPEEMAEIDRAAPEPVETLIGRAGAAVARQAETTAVSRSSVSAPAASDAVDRVAPGATRTTSASPPPFRKYCWTA